MGGNEENLITKGQDWAKFDPKWAKSGKNGQKRAKMVKIKQNLIKNG